MALLCLFFSLNSCEKNNENPNLQFTSSEISSDFESNNDLWMIGGEINGNEINATYLNEGGNPGACIKGDDNASGTFWTFNAPAKFLGNKLDYYGGIFSFDFYVNKKDDNLNNVFVTFKGNGEKLVYKINSPPALTWTNYMVHLSHSADWKIESGQGVPATQDQLKSLLRNLESIEIQGEYRIGKDEGFLDNVSMVNEDD